MSRALQGDKAQVGCEAQKDLGLGGRSRGQPEASERARRAVTQRIRNTVNRLTTVHAELALHLEASRPTRQVLSYSPERLARAELRANINDHNTADGVQCPSAMSARHRRARLTPLGRSGSWRGPR
ncbi:MAG TPA: hypothetical protein VG795_08035, partial [Acidimicrobiia bacterium]|nr:hypothetical protein [Acidimicrobiia bacterium]